MIAADSTRPILQSWLIVGGGLTTTAIFLTLLAHVPGFRWLFRRLVRDPAGAWIDARMENRITTAVGLERDSIELRIQTHVTAALKPVQSVVEDINAAVNNVGEGRQPIKDKVHDLQVGQARMEGQLDVIEGLVRQAAGGGR